MKVKVKLEVNDNEVIDEIRKKYNVEDVFENDEITNYIRNYFHPEDIFDYEELADWARENGFIKTE